ncbi:MAG: response regulator [Bryobacteraceae bacterium]
MTGETTPERDLESVGSAPPEEQLRRAVAAARGGRKNEARDSLRALLDESPNHIQGLLWAAALSETVDDAFWYLQRLLKLDPGNEQAGKILAMHEVRESMRQNGQQVDETFVEMEGAGTTWQCPLCLATASSRPRRCPRCRSIPALGDIEAILKNESVDETLVTEVAETLSRKAAAHPSFELCRDLALAYLNLKRSVEALPWLRRAAELREDESVTGAIDTLSGRRLILAVDDSPLVRRVVTAILERNGYRAVTATDGIQALARLNEATPSVILLDIEMPRMDGFQLCKVLRKNPHLKDIPVLLLTGSTTIQHRMRARLAGATDFLEKPLDEADLLAALDKHMAK